MSLFRQITQLFSCLLLLPLVGACGAPDSTQFSVVTIGNTDDPFESGVRLSIAGQLSRAATREGFVAFDEQGRVIPALADRWIITDDGKSYIFRLREGNWPGDGEITANAARIGLQKSVRALRGTALGIDLSGIEEIREMAGRVVEIRLAYPMPHLLQLLAQPELGIKHAGSGAGPMVLKRHEDTAHLTPIPPEQLGLPVINTWQDRARSVHFSSVRSEEAIRRLNEGEADLVLGGRIADFPQTALVGILRGTIQLDPVEGLLGLHVMNTRGFLSVSANREALAMAVDRETLIAPFGLDGWKATTRLVPGIVDEDDGSVSERWHEMAIEDRHALAVARVSRWRDAHSTDADIRLSVWLPKGPGAKLLYRQLAKDFSAIGVKLDRAKQDQNGDLRLIDTVARYPGTTWYLNRLNCKVGKGACSKEADAKLAEARKTESADQREALINEAQSIMTSANVFIPFGPPLRWALVRGDVRGFSSNRWGWHPLMPMALLPR